MKKKYKIILSIILISLVLDIPHVNAFSFTVDYADTGEGGETKKDKSPLDLGTETDGNKTYKYSCEYDYEIGANNNITINGYNEDKSIMDSSLKVSNEDRIPSGTSIKLNIYETKTVWYRVTKAEAMVEITTKKTCYYYDCTYTNRQGNPPGKPVPKPFDTIASITLFSRIQQIALNCSAHNQDNVQKCPEFAGCVTNSKYSHSSNCDTVEGPERFPEKDQDCKKEAAKKAVAEANKLFGASYQIEVTDSNDINGKEINKLNVSSGSGGFSGTAPSGSQTVIYGYSMNRVCINVLNSEVRYTKDEECGEEEIEVENEIINRQKYWNYFLPLNAKNNQSAEINLRPKGDFGILNNKQCHYVMKNNPVTSDNIKTSYLDLITKKDGTNFNGDYSLGERGIDYNEIEKNGCLLTSKIKIPAVQKFYNEVTVENEQTKFKGFNFYYKPIYINNPFPNGKPIETSIWKEWYESKNKEPDMTESYDLITYKALKINASSIRNYNERNLYTDWSNMTINGRSNFIDNYNHINRNGNISVYKLGCGPANKNWGDCQ